MATTTSDREDLTPAPVRLSKHERQNRFLDAFAQCHSLGEAAKVAGVDRHSHYYWIETDPTYRARFEEVQKRNVMGLEKRAIKLAKGIRKLRFHKGKAIEIEGRRVYEDRYCSSMIRFFLRANDPETYGNRPIIELNFASWDEDISRLSPGALDGIIKILNEKVAKEQSTAPKQQDDQAVDRDFDPNDSSAIETPDSADTTTSPARLREREHQNRFLAAYARCYSLEQAAKCSRLHRQNHYYWMRTDPSYPARFKQVRERVVWELRDEAFKLANGIRKLMLYKRKPIVVEGHPYYEVRYDVPMIKFVLKALAPEKYGNRRIKEVKFEDWDGDISRLSEDSKRGMLERVKGAFAKYPPW